MISSNIICSGYLGKWTTDPTLPPAYNTGTGAEDLRYYYQSDHLGSATVITLKSGKADQHIQYLPFGELFVSQRNSTFDSRYKFSAKELDNETGYSYFGARYYDSNLSIWLSVDPLSDKYPSLSPYSYCAGNPVVLKDTDGRKIKPTNPEASNATGELIMKYDRLIDPNQFVQGQDGLLGIRKDYSLRDFRRSAKDMGYDINSQEYTEAENLFKILKSEEVYEIAVVGTKSVTKDLRNYSIETNNSFVNDFKDLYRVNQEGNTTKTPSQEEITNFLNHGDIKGDQFGYFKNNNRNSEINGILFIDKQVNDNSKRDSGGSLSNRVYKGLEAILNQ
ncbi:MAG: RHS repeat-associated core domain-containing protein [Candidatus Cloacimonetes bacterium]|nr:RHS repeat-associated core domain-containing protein [Candidatus Cloacimonadota bacterium]